VEFLEVRERPSTVSFDLSTNPACFPDTCCFYMARHGTLFHVRVSCKWDSVVLQEQFDQDHGLVFQHFQYHVMFTGNSDGICLYDAGSRCPGSTRDALFTVSVRDTLLHTAHIIVFRIPIAVFSFAVRYFLYLYIHVSKTVVRVDFETYSESAHVRCTFHRAGCNVAGDIINANATFGVSYRPRDGKIRWSSRK